MTTSPYIEALAEPRSPAVARPLTAALPHRHRSSPSLLERLSRKTGPSQPPEAEADRPSEGDRQSALTARLGASLAELERVRANQPTPLDITELALTAARVVLNHELRTQRDVLHQHVEDACRTVSDEAVLRVRLHPDLAETYLKGPRPDPFGLEVIADATLEPGAIIVEGERSAADASVETRLAQFREALAFELQQDRSTDVSTEEHVA